MSLEIPEVVINRLPVYARALTELVMRGETVVSSQALGELLDVTPAQIRKDLSYFGRFGKQGRGYNVNSLLSTLREILDHDMTRKNAHYELREEGAEDLREGLSTIENRSKGLIKFIDAYREYTSLPQPKLKTVNVRAFIDRVIQLMGPEIRKSPITLSGSCESEYLTIQADEEMIEQVLINLMAQRRD